MIAEDSKKEVINNIKNALLAGDHNVTVETNDPVLSSEEKEKIVNKYLKERNSIKYKINNRIARIITFMATHSDDKATKIIGLENIEDIKGGAIITSNHFNPKDSVPIRKLAKIKKKGKIDIVGKETNLAMTGLSGFLMNYMNIIPISHLYSYMKKAFPDMLKEKLESGAFVLIYPEQEMWLNYKKPRHLKPGAYYFAAKFNVPIISCFVEIVETNEKENSEFYKTEYVLHILNPIYPDKNKTVKENSKDMMEKDYKQKKEAYEKAYGKELTYEFEKDDIAGLI